MSHQEDILFVFNILFEDISALIPKLIPII